MQRRSPQRGSLRTWGRDPSALPGGSSLRWGGRRPPPPRLLPPTPHRKPRGFLLMLTARLLGLGLLVAAAAAACSTASSGGGGGWSCSAKANCPNEPAPDQRTIDECNGALASCCGTQFQAKSICESNNVQCDAQGFVDIQATQAKCASQETAFNGCVTSGCVTDAGGG